MKKVFYSVGLLALAFGATFSFSGCNKIKDEIKKQLNPFNFTQQEFTFTLPPTAMDSAMTSATVPLNIQEIIDENAPGYGLKLSSVSALKLKKVTLELVEGQDDANNWTNFTGIFFVAYTDKSEAAGLPWQGVNIGINDDASSKYMTIDPDFPEPRADLKGYFNETGNTQTSYILQTGMRRSTTVPLKIKAKVEYSMVP